VTEIEEEIAGEEERRDYRVGKTSNDSSTINNCKNDSSCNNNYSSNN